MTVQQRIVRVRRTYNQWVANQTLEDYSLRFTAKRARKWSTFRVANTAIGAVSFLALEAIGGTITVNYGFLNASAAILAVGTLIFLTGFPIARYASTYGVDIDLLTRGAGFGYVGGCVPLRSGIVLSLMRMNRIKEIHPGDFVAVVQPGVLTATLQDAVERRGLFYPPDPASRADCSIGGNIATNAGGPRCLKYGVTRDYVLGLEVVLADGSIARLGGRTHKNKTGFDLARLMTGSEGLLGVVTEATLKLLPLPPYRACLAAGFSTTRDAARAVREILAAGFLPCALEIADEFTLAAARKRTKSERLSGCRAHRPARSRASPAGRRSRSHRAAARQRVADRR